MYLSFLIDGLIRLNEKEHYIFMTEFCGNVK